MSAPERRLTLLDAVCVMMGIIIGAGIFETTPDIAAGAGSTWGLLGVWILGGVLSLAGALCYAELILNHPESGGDYVYLQRAFGPICGFLYAWSQFWIVRPAAVGSVAFVFGEYAQRIWPLGCSFPETAYAALAVLGLTLVNLLGLSQGKGAQNVLTAAKVLGLLLVFAAALGASGTTPATSVPKPSGSFALALIFSLYAFGGWSDLAFVGAEIKQPERNVLRSMVLAIVGVTAVYALLSLSFIAVLGFNGAASAKAVAAETLEQVFTRAGWESGRAGLVAAAAVSGLICVSALGSINGQVFTGARIFYAFGKDHVVFRRLGNWHGKLAVPVWSLVSQGVITLALVGLFGTPAWNALADAIHGTAGAPPMSTGTAPPDVGAATNNGPAGASNDSPRSAGQGKDGFDRMVIFSTPIVWAYYALVGVGLFVLRRKWPGRCVFRVPVDPWVPLVFIGSSAYVGWCGLSYAWANRSYEALWAIGLLVLGWCVYPLSRRCNIAAGVTVPPGKS